MKRGKSRLVIQLYKQTAEILGSELVREVWHKEHCLHYILGWIFVRIFFHILSFFSSSLFLYIFLPLHFSTFSFLSISLHFHPLFSVKDEWKREQV